MTTTFIVDDHQMFRDGIRKMLSLETTDVVIIGEASTGEELFEKLKITKPDLILLDILLPDISGIEISEIVHRQWPDIKILVLTAESEKETLLRLAEIGVNGFIGKMSPFEELLSAINTIADGGEYWGKDIARMLNNVRISKRTGVQSNMFTPREMNIIRLCAHGKTAKEIADDLGIAIKTVTSHKYNIFKKLGINSTTELVSYCLKNHIIRL